MYKLACNKVDVSALRLIYVTINAPFISAVNSYSYANAFLIRLKERVVIREEYGLIDQANFSIFFEKGRYGVSIKLAFLPETKMSDLVKVIAFLISTLSEPANINLDRDDFYLCECLEEEMMNLKPAMVVDLSRNSTRHSHFVKSLVRRLFHRFVKISAIQGIDIFYTSNMPEELERYFENAHSTESSQKQRRMKPSKQGSIYLPSQNECCMVMAFPRVDGSNFLEWKVVEALLSILLFEVARTEYGMAYDLSCDLDLTNNVLCVQAGLGSKDSIFLEEIIANICKKIYSEDYACERLEGIKLIQKIAFAQLWDSPEELLDANYFLSFFGLSKLNYGEIENRIGEITWDSIKRRIQELDFSFKICWS